MQEPTDDPGPVLLGRYDAPPLQFAGRDGTRHGSAMCRRAIVFCIAFTVCALASLAYTFMRSPLYRADARLQVTPAEKLAKADLPTADNTAAVLAELQVLNSRPLLEKVVARLKNEGEVFQGAVDPVLAVQAMLHLSRVEGTNVIRLEASGAQKLLLPRLINTLVEVYREQQAGAGQSSTQTELTDARAEVGAIESRAADMQRSTEAFRVRARIVSTERDENNTLSGLKGLGISLSAAADREALAEGKVQALEQAMNEGGRVAKAKDNPTLASIEQRLSQAREEWRALERQFTPQYLDLDPNARALRTRIANLEQQLQGEQVNSQQRALAEAKEELAGAKAATRRLQQQLAQDKQSAQTFSRQFGEFQAMQEELRGLEKMRMAARQRLLSLEASQVARRPRTQVLELAAIPDSAWWPPYWRDAGFALAGSLLLGLMAVWFVEFFNRSEPLSAGPQTIVFPQPWPAPAPYGVLQLGAAGGASPLPFAAQTPLLSASRLRELADDEVRALLARAAAEHQPLLLCLLSGLSAAETVALRVAHVDTRAQALNIPGERGQPLPVEAHLLSLLADDGQWAGDAPVFRRAAGEALTLEDLQVAVTSSALDAALQDAQDIVPETLRHTYIAFLVRQGLRFSDLRRVVGQISADQLNALAALAAGSERVGLDAVDRLLPAVRAWAQGRSA
jgi:succinoglycan biosynthesis transport protein ExoP